MFGCLSPSISTGDIDTLTDELLMESTSISPKLLDLSRYEPLDQTIRPWAQGYNLAQRTYRQLKALWDFNDIVPIRHVLKDLGVPVRVVSLLDKDIRAVSVESHKPNSIFILMNKSCPLNSKETGQRFSLAHELGHLLFDRDKALQMAVASGSWAPPELEKRANAFAAMLLMPPEVIDQNLPPSGKTWTRTHIEELALTLECGFVALLEHLVNLDYLPSSMAQVFQEDRAV